MILNRKCLLWILWITGLTGLVTSSLTVSPVAFAQAASIGQVYRIVILSDLSYQEANKGKDLLQEWKYEPVIITEQQPGTDKFRVLYGYFPTPEAARHGLSKLQSEGISVKEIVNTPASISDAANKGSRGITYSIFIQEFADEAQAQALKSRIQQADFSPVHVRKINDIYSVYVGNGDPGEINRIFVRLGQQGYTIPNVSKQVVAPAEVPAVSPIPDVRGRPQALQGSSVISSEITQSPMWKQLTPEQQNQVINSVKMQQELRSGDELAQQVIDINKRLENLDERVKTVVKQFDEERAKQQKVMKEINDKTAEAENYIRSSDYQKAILRYRDLLELDKENRYGQKPYIERRLAFLQSRLKGESYEGEADANQRSYEKIKKEIEPLTRSSNVDDLNRARVYWQEIKAMDPDKYGQEATTQINNLSQQIDTFNKTTQADQLNAHKQQQYLIWGLAGGVALLLLIVILASWRQHGKHKEIMRRMQEITSIRPMRELTGGSTGLLGGPSATAGSDTDIFTPRSPGGNESEALDPLGGLEPEPLKKKKGKATPAAAAAESENLDAIFGSLGSESVAPVASASASGGSDAFGFDDIFGAPQGQTGQVTAAPTEASGLSDSSFNNLFEVPSGSVAAGNAPQSQPPVQQEPAKPASGPISFEDLVAVSDESPGGPPNDLLSMFGSIGDQSESGNGQQPVSQSGSVGLDHLAGSPFDDFMNEPPPSEVKTGARPAPPVEDDTEIPSIRLDMSDTGHGSSAQSSINFDLNNSAPESDQTNTSVDLPSFSFDDLMPVESVGIPGAASSPAAGAAATQLTASIAGVELDFEEDVVGQPPAGWEGEYPFAALLVKADSPPRGSHQYLAFEKREGAGKALFTYRFPNIQGVLGIEFDLRCNDKNKFLLGFYIEHDGDFQQSIHTKILRSEAQTTPTIHMQGESAPYLLGSWAHIKYVVDLNKAKLNGYIDSTHVARDLVLNPNPGELNTLAIRDNINTTGILLLDNIKIYQIA